MASTILVVLFLPVMILSAYTETHGYPLLLGLSTAISLLLLQGRRLFLQESTSCKPLFFIALVTLYFCALPLLLQSPLLFFLASAGTIHTGFLITDITFFSLRIEQHTNPGDSSYFHAAQSTAASACLAICIGVIAALSPYLHNPVLRLTLPATTLLALIPYGALARVTPSPVPKLIAGMSAAILLFSLANLLFLPSLLIALILYASSRYYSGDTPSSTRLWNRLTANPEQTLLSTFLFLSVSGTVLLLFPYMTTSPISIIDAGFTAVSAVCVTGLIVLDTPTDFTFLGQLTLLLLIQVGGLGIMSISTLAIHLMGKRLSVRQEKTITTMMDIRPQDIASTLRKIFTVTFTAETVGALILTSQFIRLGDSFFTALWRGVFTAVSAFCNAGFALQSASLIEYNGNHIILHTVSILIILGSIAPVTTLALPRFFTKKALTPTTAMVCKMSALLLFVGFLAVLVFEWHNVLAPFSLGERISNAWFHSATLRTAGFNALGIAEMQNATVITMLLLMFIGGSPGGTAGGIKTTTVAVLSIACYTYFSGAKEYHIKNRRILSETIIAAMATAGAAFVVWIGSLFLLELTQDIPIQALLFEVTSALGTVGLSMGVTDQLDSVGKIIVMLIMFTGRIAPITLFILCAKQSSKTHLPYPTAKIPLT